MIMQREEVIDVFDISWNVYEVFHVMEEGHGIVVGPEQDDLAIEQQN
jgi:hypothetical protein